MSTKATDLFQSFLSGKLDRRELFARSIKLGLTGLSAGLLLNRMQSEAFAQSGWDWQKQKGTAIKLLLNKHPYADAMIVNIEHFKKLTGIDVTYDVFPEDVYFDKVTSALSSKSSQYDVFMTGAYQTWQYGPAGWLTDTNEFLHDPQATAPEFKWEDVLSNLRSSTAWSGVAGQPLGGANAKQWAIPLGFELNSLTYNRRILDQLKVDRPTHLPDLIEKAAKISRDSKGVYGIGTRGSRSWATIHAGYLSGLVNYGGGDFKVQNGKLTSIVNSPECKAFTRLWVEMIQRGGPRNWTNYTWYEVANDLGAGASAMIYDADIIGFFQDKGTKEAGNLEFYPLVPNPKAATPTPNVWIWSLAVAAASTHKQAAWKFIQWASGTEQTTFGATKADLVNPVRQSVWSTTDFQTRLNSYSGYLTQYNACADHARIYFTPQPLFFNLTTEWAASLQKMYSKQLTVDEGLDQLADSVMGQLKDAGISE